MLIQITCALDSILQFDNGTMVKQLCNLDISCCLVDTLLRRKWIKLNTKTVRLGGFFCIWGKNASFCIWNASEFGRKYTIGKALYLHMNILIYID